MDKEIAKRIATEIEAAYPHVATLVTSDKQRAIVGVFSKPEDGIGDCEFVLDSEYEWNKIQKVLSVFVPQK